MSTRFSERNGKFIQALSALHPRSESFLDGDKVKPLLDLTGMEFKEAEFSVAQQFLKDEIAKSDENCTTAGILQRYNESLSAMPTVLQTLKLGLTFGASTATCESSFSTLKNVFSDHRRNMLQKRKANLIQFAVERDLTCKFTGEWKEKLLRRFSTASRRLQLF